MVRGSVDGYLTMRRVNKVLKKITKTEKETVFLNFIPWMVLSYLEIHGKKISY